ncbi:MAG: phosphoglycerate dehydrogenase [Alphaproteobacteria bacterium]
MPKVLIADKMSPLAEKIFRSRGIDVDVKAGLDKDELNTIIGNYDGVAVRSATKIRGDAIARAEKLKVIGRAGIGVDTIDVPAATAKGIVVMNTPYGNSVTTAEHAIALLMAIARDIPAANASTHAGKWEKSRFMGVEVTGKTLGIIGCGNIGSIVVRRAKGLEMKVIAYDPFLSEDRAKDLGVEKVELDNLFKRADFISLHTPLTDKTRNIIDAKAFALMKKGVRIVNAARGGLMDEKALKAALDSGKVARVALDVFEEEPATKHPLFGDDRVVATPHLGASTSEAQEKVAEQIAEQMADFLLLGAVTNAVNMPSITADEAPRIRPYVSLAEKLGSFVGQLTDTSIEQVSIEYEGAVAELKTTALTAAALAGLLAPQMAEVNMVNAPVVARERGIKVSETKRAQEGVFEAYIRVIVKSGRGTRSIAGTLYSGNRPRIIQIDGIDMDAAWGPNMLCVVNVDKPGFVGAVGQTFEAAGINIATFALGRTEAGGHAIALVEIDAPITPEILAKVQGLKNVIEAKALKF